MIKDTKIPLDGIKVCERCYAFDGEDCVTIISWRDEKTLVFKYTNDEMNLQMWSSGRLVKEFDFCHTPTKPTIFSASMDFCHVQENLLDQKWNNFLDA